MKEIIYLLFVLLSLSGYSQSKKHKKTRAQKTVLNASLVKDSLGVKNSAFSKIEFLEPEKFKIDSIAAQLKKYSESKKNTDYLASKKKKKKSKKDNSWFQSQFQKKHV